MEVDRIIGKLQENFGLRANEVLILRAVKDNELSAVQICHKTGIPKGRIYDFLNSLLKSGLIKKTNNMPYKYGIGDFKKSVLEFLKKKEDEFQRKEGFLRDSLEKEAPEMIMIESRAQLLEQIRLSFKDDKTHKIILLGTPNIFFPEDPVEALKIRNFEDRIYPTTVGRGKESIPYHEEYREAYKDKTKKFYYLMKEGSFRPFLNLLKQVYTSDEYCQRITQIKKDLKRYNISLRVSKGKSFFPYYFSVTDSRVFLLFVSQEVQGLVIRRPNVVKMYNRLFDEAYAHAKSFKPLMDKAIKGGKCELQQDT